MPTTKCMLLPTCKQTLHLPPGFLRLVAAVGIKQDGKDSERDQAGQTWNDQGEIQGVSQWTK